jgi:hypothetical protein
MKKYIFILILITGLASCNEGLLDIPQQGVLSTETYYTAADDNAVTSLITAIYYEIRGNIADPNSTSGLALGSVNSALYTRSILERMSGDFSDEFEYIETASGGSYSYIWSYYYTIIYWCNMIIEKLPANTVASEKVKTQVIAEARAIRAIMMMYLVQLYGNPPLADHAMDGTEGNTPAEESWTFINSELAAAAEGLPSKAGKGGQSAIGGRLTKEAAYAYLGKAYLWQKNYAEAAKTLHDKVIASGLYELNPDFRELNRYTADFCDEYLWEYDVTNEGDYSLSQAGYMEIAYFTWTNIYYPDEIFSDQGWGNIACSSDAFGSFMDTHDVVGGNKSGRYLGTIATFEDILDLYTYEDNATKGVRNPVEFCEGYFRVRLMARVENVMGGSSWFYKYTHNNLCYMRYSEVLLNYAEAVAMGGANGSVTGLQALNQVRTRAGLTDAPALDMENAVYGVKAERWAEFHWEGIRFIDLVRWGDASTTLANMGKTKTVFYGYNNGQNSTSQNKGEWKIIKAARLGEGFKTGKNGLFPIPTVEMSSNPTLKQNPGW